jgi:indolepyruvate ferredoxin oxidoreductase
MALDKLGEPAEKIHDMSSPGTAWRCHMSGVGGMGIGVVGAILVRAGHNQGYRVVFQDKKGLAIRNGGVFSQITFINQNEEKSEYPTTGSIPYGRADLLLGIDILEAARATDPRAQFRVASKEHTAAVLNMHKQPTVYTLLGTDDFDTEKLREEIYSRCQEHHSYAKNLSELCEQRLGSKQFVNIMMLGVAFQLGLIPVSAHSIAWAIKDTIRRDHRKNLKAFNIGRKLALEPRALPRKPEPETWEQLVVNKARILRKSKVRGAAWSGRYERIVEYAMKAMAELPEDLKYDLALRIYDIQQYENHRLAKRFVDLLIPIYRRDTKEKRFAATAAAIWNLAKVFLIKDEPYVAYLLTRYEKRQRDIAKYNVDVNNGDRIVYRHHTSPEFTVGPYRVRFKITTRDWMLKIARHCKWWRRLPGWHRRETAFRDWYVALLDRVNFESTGYEQAVKVLKAPEQVSGYREVRYPKMEKVMAEVEQELSPHRSEPPRPVHPPRLLESIRRPSQQVG